MMRILRRFVNPLSERDVCFECSLLTSESQMGEKSGDPRFGNEWEDDEDMGDGQPQCQTQ